MRKNSFDQFKNILHLLLLKPRIMPWLRASRLGLKAARSTGDYHIIHMLFFLWPPYVRRHSRGLLEDCRFNINCQKGIMPYVN